MIYTLWMKGLSRKIIFLSLFLSLVGCKKYDDLDTSTTPESTNISLGELRAQIANKAATIEQELVVGGYVTSSDRANNFYHTFTFQDFTAAAEVMAGLYDLHNIYPQGYYITINLRGCTLAMYNGVLQIGRQAKSYSNYPTDYFSSRVLLDKHIKPHNIYQPISPTSLDIQALNSEQCGKLVRIDNLKLCSSDYHELWKVNVDGTWSGYNIFRDHSNNTLIVYTSEYANYAEQRIPSDEVSITGILQYGKFNGADCFFIKMRDEKDCSILH